MANVVAIGFVLSEYVFHELILSKWIIGILFFPLSINGLRYKVPSVYEKKYQDETDAEKKRKGYGVLLYVLLSLAMVIINTIGNICKMHRLRGLHGKCFDIIGGMLVMSQNVTWHFDLV